MSERQIGKNSQETCVSTLQGVVCSNPGNPIAPVYKRVSDADGKFVVEKVDEMNIQEFIQASKSTTDLATLQKRFIELGEIPNVNPDLVYDENAVFPSDIHSLYNMVNDVNGSFNSLPESVRNVFGNSQAYLAAILDGSYKEKLAEAFAPIQNNANDDTTKGDIE